MYATRSEKQRDLVYEKTMIKYKKKTCIEIDEKMYSIAARKGLNATGTISQSRSSAKQPTIGVQGYWTNSSNTLERMRYENLSRDITRKQMDCLCQFASTKPFLKSEEVSGEEHAMMKVHEA